MMCVSMCVISCGWRVLSCGDPHWRRHTHRNHGGTHVSSSLSFSFHLLFLFPSLFISYFPFLCLASVFSTFLSSYLDYTFSYLIFAFLSTPVLSLYRWLHLPTSFSTHSTPALFLPPLSSPPPSPSQRLTY